jgi:hypothetical protein
LITQCKLHCSTCLYNVHRTTRILVYRTRKRGCILYTDHLECLVVYCTPVISNTWLYIVHQSSRILVCILYTGHLEYLVAYCTPNNSNTCLYIVHQSFRILVCILYSRHLEYSPSSKYYVWREQRCKETQEVINSCKTKKDKQYNGLKKKRLTDKQNIHKTLHRKLMNRD